MKGFWFSLLLSCNFSSASARTRFLIRPGQQFTAQLRSTFYREPLGDNEKAIVSEMADPDPAIAVRQLGWIVRNALTESGALSADAGRGLRTHWPAGACLCGSQ